MQNYIAQTHFSAIDYNIRKIAFLSLHILYLHHVWKSRGGGGPPFAPFPKTPFEGGFLLSFKNQILQLDFWLD